MEQSTDHVVEHFFRHESANVIAVLTRAFGVRRIELVEDMVQVAMLEAMRAWGQRGVPENPAAWIHKAARHRILDSLRREKTYQQAVAFAELNMPSHEKAVDDCWEHEHIPDSVLRMMFVCCHPTLERKSQIALTLKTLCGFSVAEIARGLLLPVEIIKKRIQRAKKTLVDANVPIDVPNAQELAERLNVVHSVLYLMFNEGYSTTQGAEPIRDDICEDAARLCHLLCESPYALPSSQALLALLLFHAARVDARTDEQGCTVLLEDQDRAKWDRRLIRIAQGWLSKSKSVLPTTYHLEAAIAMQHCIASSVETTNWQLIVRLYTRLLELNDSPVYSLNRAIAIGQTGDLRTAMTELNLLSNRPEMTNYALLDCAIAKIHELAGERDMAIDRYRIAHSKSVAPHERKLLERKLSRLPSEP